MFLSCRVTGDDGAPAPQPHRRAPNRPLRPFPPRSSATPVSMPRPCALRAGRSARSLRAPLPPRYPCHGLARPRGRPHAPPTRLLRAAVRLPLPGSPCAPPEDGLPCSPDLELRRRPRPVALPPPRDSPPPVTSNSPTTWSSAAAQSPSRKFRPAASKS